MYILRAIILSSYNYRHFLNRQWLEYWWTVVPICIVIGLWFPSIANLYRMDELKHPDWNVKAIGNQWYWRYEVEFRDDAYVEVQSYLQNGDGLENGEGYRLLDVDWRLVAPAQTQMTVYVSSADVLHSFALPGLLLKADAIPGRINQIPIKVRYSCVIYGQCSEICGVNHSFIPIVVEFIPLAAFLFHQEECLARV